MELTEAELAAAFRAGDRGAVAEAFDRHADRIYRHCFRITGSRADAEDATASTFLEVWRHRDRIVVHDDSVLPWLYGVATNVCRNLLRGHRRQVRLSGRMPVEVVADPAEEVEARVDAEARMREVLVEVSRLPRREQDVLALVVWSGLDYAAAAAALGVPVGTVRSRLSRARARLSRDQPAEGVPS
ncbi:RNA polymerase sigma factor [Nocardioides sp. R-C-SC26]|uniref:RNA polymerase sigma factor n=1 Tax=Nocardioides sp. R-C-SC26 TaxID=2870414 RepID=UPI001E4A4925|nr:RNA polymerase sigma factor [Nocardioides sp. R-C-SC26]